MALREDARPRRPTPFPLRPPPRPAPPAAPPAAQPGPNAPQSSPALVAAPPCLRLTHSPTRLTDAAAATGPPLGPAAGRRGEGTALARILQALREELRLGSTPHRFGALQIRRGRGEKRTARRGWATRSEVSRGASREGRRGSQLAARGESARRATCGCGAASGGGIWARRRVIGRFVVQGASVMLPRAGGPGATSGSRPWVESRVSSGFA